MTWVDRFIFFQIYEKCLVILPWNYVGIYMFHLMLILNAMFMHISARLLILSKQLVFDKKKSEISVHFLSKSNK